MALTDDDLLSSSNSIQVLLGKIGILAEEMARECEPHRHIVFLKKHKCASSTIYDILNRYKKKHRLFAASKPIGSFVGGYPNYFNSTFIAPPQADKYDIIFNHFRWNEAEVKKVTFDDTIFLTSVREPLSHYKSVFDFFYGTFNKEEKIVNHFCNLACSGAPFLEMLRGAGYPFEHFMTCVPDCYDSTLPWSFRAKNFQVFEMGLDNDHEDLDRLEAHLDGMNEVRSVCQLLIDLSLALDYGCGLNHRTLCRIRFDDAQEVMYELARPIPTTDQSPQSRWVRVFWQAEEKLLRVPKARPPHVQRKYNV